MAKIILTTCQAWPDALASDRLIAEHLIKMGHEVQAFPWDAPFSHFATSDLVVLRANWDFHEKVADFEQWLSQMEHAPATLLNPPSIVRWNLKKSYMVELAESGIVTPQTLLFDSGEGLRRIYAEQNWETAVLKPLYGASGTLVEQVPLDRLDGWLERVYRQRPADGWMAQAYLENITGSGELSLIFIDGRFSHAVRKVPQAGEFRINSRYGGIVSPADVPADIVAQAARTVAFVTGRFSLTPLYVRIDGVVAEDGTFCLLELELNEPTLYCDHVPAGAVTMAEAIGRRVERIKGKG